jgi:hypothetical protein
MQVIDVRAVIAIGVSGQFGLRGLCLGRAIAAAKVSGSLHISNSTVEKIAVLLKVQPRGMLMIVDELAGLFLNLARYSGGSDREFWLEAWNGKYYVVERMGREPVVLNHLLVGMTGGFQPDTLNSSFGGAADGIYTRMLFAWPPEPAYQKLTDHVEEIEPELYNTLTRLIDLPAEQDDELLVSLVSLSPDARSAFEDFRKQFTQGRLRLMVMIVSGGRRPRRICSACPALWLISTGPAAQPANGQHQPWCATHPAQLCSVPSI